MVRRPGCEPSNHESLAVTRIKGILKESSPETRAYILKWLVKYFNDNGGMFSPQITQERRKVTIDSTAYWLVKIPGTKGNGNV
jgi:hypothetical protein